MRPDLLIIGNRGGTNIGGSLERAARRLGLHATLIESKESMDGPAWLARACWHLCDHRPLRLSQFSRAVSEWCRVHRPRILLATGLAPLTASALQSICRSGTITANFLTDDPWNPAHKAGWFMAAISSYRYVFTPRTGNQIDLSSAGVSNVVYCPFAYDPELFSRRTSLSPEEESRFGADVMFAGGADADRVPYIAALQEAGLRIALYGTYWEKYEATKRLSRGQLPISELPIAVAASKLALCTVRRANRDGHSMRSFELPALGCCMLTEETDDHRAIFGPEGESVVYFRDMSEMAQKAVWLLDKPQERLRLAAAVHSRITSSNNTYQDRLESMLSHINIAMKAL